MGEQRTVIPGHNGPTDPSAFGGLVAARTMPVQDHPDQTRTERETGRLSQTDAVRTQSQSD